MAMATGDTASYGDGLRPAPPSAGKLAERTTEMADLSALLGANRQRLRSMLNVIEERLDGFSPQPAVPQNAINPATTSPQPPEPMPGTLASLQCLARTTDQELNRLDALCMRLRELL